MKSLKKPNDIYNPALPHKKAATLLKKKSAKKKSKLSEADLLKQIHKLELQNKKQLQAKKHLKDDFSESIINKMPGIFYLYDETGKFIKWNKNFEQLSGYTGKEISQMHPLDFYDTDQKEIIKKRITNVFKKDSPGIVVELLTKQKNKISFFINSKTVIYKGKKCVMGIGADITERIKAEKNNEQSEKKYKLLADKASDIVWLMDLTGKSFYVSPSIERFTGFTMDEYLNQTIEDRFTPESALRGREIFSGEIKKYVENKINLINYSITLVLDYRCKDGFSKTGELIITPYFNENNELIGIHGVTRDITERIKSEKLLQASENRYRLIIEKASEGILIAQDNKLKFVNPKILELTGYTEKEMLGTPFIKFVHPDYRKLIINNYEKRLRSESIDPKTQIKIITKDKSTLWVELKGVKIEWEGKPAVMNFISDITETKKVEEKLQEKEKQYRTLFENAQVGIYRTTPDGHIVSANPALVKMLGYPTLDELMKRNLEKEGFEPAYPRNDFKKMIELKGEVMGVESKWKRYDGTVIFVNENTKVIKGKNGQIIYYEGTVEDITKRKMAEEEIIAREKKHRSLIEQASDAIFISRPDGIYEDVNSSGCQLFGYSREEFLKLTVMDLVFKEDLENNPIHFNDMRAGKTIQYERRMKRKDGTSVEVEITGKMIADRRNLIFARDITERKKIEKTLKESEKDFRGLFENHSAVKLILDPDTGDIFDANEAAVEFYGWTYEELKKMKIQQINANDTLEKIKERLLYSKNNQQYHYELKHKKADGIIRDVEIYGNVVTMAGRTLIHSIIFDITNRKRTEEALLESELKYRELVENSPDAIAIYIDGKIIFVNQATVSMLAAKSKEDLIGKSVLQFVHPDYQALVIERMKMIKTSENVLPVIEEKFIRLDGSEVDVEVKAMLISFENKQAVQMIVRDISERKKAIDALNLSERRFKTLFEKASDGILLMSAEGKIVNVNESFAKMHGYKVDEMLKMNLRDLDTPEMKKYLPEKITFVMEGKTLQMETDHYHKDGHIVTFAISSSLVQVGNEKYIQAFHQDISERKKAEKELQHLNKELRELSAHLQTVRDEERLAIANEIHDELGQNLVALNMNSLYLKNKIKDLNKEDQEIFNEQIKVTQNLINTSRRIFDLLHPSMLNELGLEAAIDWYSKDQLNTYKINVMINSNLGGIKFPKEISLPIFRILQDILSNVKLHAKATKVIIKLLKEENTLTLSVEDNGVGFDTTAVDILNSHGLLGIRERVYAINGKLNISSTIGKGTTITVVAKL